MFTALVSLKTWARPATDASPSSQPVTKTGLQVPFDYLSSPCESWAQVPVSTGMVQVDCGMASQAAGKLDILGVLVGNFLYWWTWTGKWCNTKGFSWSDNDHLAISPCQQAVCDFPELLHESPEYLSRKIYCRNRGGGMMTGGTHTKKTQTKNHNN